MVAHAVGAAKVQPQHHSCSASGQLHIHGESTAKQSLAAAGLRSEWRSAEQKQRTCTSVCIKASQRRSGPVGSLMCTCRRSVAFKRRAVSRSGAVVVPECSSKCSRRRVAKRVTQLSTAVAVAANDADAADWHPCGSAPPTAGCVWQTAASCAASTPLLRLLRSPVVVLDVVVFAVEETGVSLSSS
jgi:hypothetical protein